jgi:dihydroorotase
MVDAHVHFMDPGDTSREDFPNGSAAAAVAGVTTVIEHNHACPVYTGDDFRKKVGYLKNRSVVDFGLGAHLLPNGLEGVEDAIREGAAFIKVFTCTTHGLNGAANGPLLKAMIRFEKHGTAFLVHAEDESLTETAEAELRASGREDGGVIPEWRSRLAEQVAVNTVAQLAFSSKAKVVIAHCSHPEILDIIIHYRCRGVHIWAESCPQYFFLKEEEVHPMKGFRKFTPPARAATSVDFQSMWERLRNGGISYISSDHAPATRSQKEEGSIWTVPFGLPGIDTTLPLMLDAVSKGYLNYPRLVEVYSKIPACLYGLYPRKGSLHIGSDADFVLVDPEATWILEDKDILSKAGWTPYAGYPLKGRVIATYVRGSKMAEEGRCIGPPGWGQFVPGKGFNRRGKD